MESPNTPAGWYDDGKGALRWWDGQGWTDHTRAGDDVAGRAQGYVQNLVARPDPADDPETIWSAVGKPITGIGAGRYKLTARYLFFERGTLSTKAQQISTHEIYDVDAVQSITQKARGVGTIVLYAIRSGSGTRELVELVDVEGFREGVAELNRVSYEARENLRMRQQMRTVNYAAPAAVAPPADAGRGDLIAELEKLANLKERGILDDGEFAAAKRKLLDL